ncbi:hypothetical protein O9929_20845 [Vibrio lentus]|nr:hypothetical protein [Vibrio lentus]
MGFAMTIIAFVLGIQMALANGTQLVLSRALVLGVDFLQHPSIFGQDCSSTLASQQYSGFLLTFFEQPLIQASNLTTKLHLEISHHSGYFAKNISCDFYCINAGYHRVV